MNQQREYIVVLERGSTNWGAYCPDVPGCGAVGDTREEALRLFQEAIIFHFEGLREDGETLPEPVSEAVTIAVNLAQVPVAA